MSANESRDNPGSSHGDGGGAASAVVVARPLAQSRRPHPFSGATRSAVITSRHVTAGPDKAVGSGSGTVGRTSPRRQHTRTPTKLQTPEGHLSMLLTLVQTDESVVTARCQTGPLTDRTTRPAYRGGDGARTGLAPARPHGVARSLSLWLRFNQVCVSSASRQTRRAPVPGCRSRVLLCAPYSLLKETYRPSLRVRFGQETHLVFIPRAM